MFIISQDEKDMINFEKINFIKIEREKKGISEEWSIIAVFSSNDEIILGTYHSERECKHARIYLLDSYNIYLSSKLNADSKLEDFLECTWMYMPKQDEINFLYDENEELQLCPNCRKKEGE